MTNGQNAESKRRLPCNEAVRDRNTVEHVDAIESEFNGGHNSELTN